MSSIKRRVRRATRKPKRGSKSLFCTSGTTSAMVAPGKCQHCGRYIETTAHSCQIDKNAGND